VWEQIKDLNKAFERSKRVLINASRWRWYRTSCLPLLVYCIKSRYFLVPGFGGRKDLSSPFERETTSFSSSLVGNSSHASCKISCCPFSSPDLHNYPRLHLRYKNEKKDFKSIAPEFLLPPRYVRGLLDSLKCPVMAPRGRWITNFLA